MSGPEDCELKSLHDAVESKNLDLLESLLKDGSDPNAVDDTGRTALNFICYQDELSKIDLKIIQLLIQYGADVNTQDEDGNSPMMNLFYDDSNDMRVRIEALKLLLKKGADVTCVNHKGQTIFSNIILCNPANLKTAVALDMLLKNGTDPNMIVDNEYDETALNFICDLPKLTKVHLKMIQILLQYNADVNTQDEYGYTPIINLFRGAENYKLRLEVCKLLLENGADVTLLDHEGNTILHIIIQYNAEKNPTILEAVELMLKSGVDVNIQNSNGYSALHFAAIKRLQVVALLLKHGADPNKIDNKGMTALNFVCLRPGLKIVELKIIQLLIQYKANLNIQNCIDNSPIMTLFHTKENNKVRLEIFKLLLENGADVTLINNEGNTVLHNILFFYEKSPYIIQTVQLLLKSKVDVNIRNGNGLSALLVAVINCKRTKLINLLSKMGADLNIVDNSGRTPLNYICCRDKLTRIDFKMIQILIQHNADVNIKDKKGFTPIECLLCTAKSYKFRLKVFKLLLENGAVVQNVTNAGDTILHNMFFHGAMNPNIIGVVKLLIELGVDVNIQNKNGWSALHAAVDYCEHIKVIDLLLKNGADPNIVGNNGRTALHLICSRHKLTRIHLKMIQLLIQYGADVNTQDEDGFSPIVYLLCASKNYKLRLEVCKLLLENGADVTLINNEGNTVLHLIFEYNAEKNPIIFEAVELLLKSGVGVNKQNENGHSALHVAVQYSEDIKVIDLLLRNGADPNIVDDLDWTPLHFLYRRTEWTEVHLEIIQLLIQYKANVIIQNKYGDAPIMNLFFGTKDCNSRLEVFKLVAKYHVDDTSLDEFGSKVLPEMFESGIAISNIAKEVEFLLEIGVNVNILSKYGFSALHNAVYSLQLEQVEFLLKNGADPNITDVNGDIPLNYNFKSCDSIKLLRKLEKFFPILELNIEYNADISHCGGDGQTVLHSLIMNSSSFRYFLVYDDEEENHLERISKYVHQYVEVLLKHGLDVNVKNRDGSTALNEAVSYCNYDIAKILVEHGADVNTVQFKGGFFENKVPQSLNLLTTLNVLAIIELWQSKGFQINSYQYLRIFKFLTLFDDTKMNNDFLSSLNYVWHNTSVPIPSHQWIDIFECGSGSVIRKYDEALFLVINDSSNCTDFNIATLKIIVYTVIKLHLCLVEYGNMYMDIETYNYLQNKMNLLVSENPEIEEHYRKCRDKRHIDILDQVDSAKKMIISNNISYLDLCTSSPDKTYYLLQKCDYESAINSADFMINFNKIGGIIRGYIIKALVRRLITQSTTDSIKLLSHGILPDLCCDKIIKFLDVIDLVSVYEAVVNYKC